MRNLHGKSGKMQGKSGNFRGIHSSRWQNRREIVRSFPVISGHFQSFFRSFLVMIPIDSAKSFRFIPNDSFSFLFFPFHSTFIPQPLVFMLYNIFPADFPKIPAVSLGGSKYSSYFCNRLKDDSKLSGRATVSPMASQPQAFFMPEEYHFPGIGKKVYRYGGCMNRKI